MLRRLLRGAAHVGPDDQKPSDRRDKSFGRPKPRYEFKYHLPESVAREMVEFIKPYCEPDKHMPSLDGAYTITSIYMDSPSLAMYWAKKTIQHERLKARVRTYGPTSDGPVFAELKRRYGDVIVKSRALVPRDRWTTLMSSAELTDAEAWGMKPDHVEALRAYESEIRRWEMDPLISIRYERQAFVGLFEPRTRVTFDRNLRWAPATDAGFPREDSHYHSADFPYTFGHNESRVILEMKFDDAWPIWMRDIVSHFELLRDSFSKYCTCVDCMLEEPVGHFDRDLPTSLLV